MSEKKFYAVGCHDAQAWETLNQSLTQEGTLELNVPSRAVKIADLQEHSETRAVYYLTDEEAEQLKNNPLVNKNQEVSFLL